MAVEVEQPGLPAAVRVQGVEDVVGLAGVRDGDEDFLLGCFIGRHGHISARREP
jgi:hypothetical protein